MTAPPISEVVSEVYEIPTDQPEADGTLTWTSTTMVLVRVRAGTVEGLGWTYAAPGAAGVVDATLGDLVTGGDPMAVPQHHEAMVRACRNQGRPGIVACAISAVDIALWDLKARLLDLSLADLWGRLRAEAPVYGSGGFTSYDDDTTRQQLHGWRQQGIDRVKIKIGESWGSDAARDLHRVALARQVVGDAAELYVDANGGYSAKQAVRIGKAMVEESGVSWFEEPVSSDDLAGLHQVREPMPGRRGCR